MIPHRGRGLLVVLAALSGMSAGALGQQPGPEAPAQQVPAEHQQVPPQQQQASPQQQQAPPQQQQASPQQQQAPPQQQQAPPQQQAAPQPPGAQGQPGAPQPPAQLGRPFPAPVQPPPRKEEPRVYVGIVSPQDSRLEKNRQRTPSLRNGGSALQSGSQTDNARERPAGSVFGQPVE